MSRKVMNKNLQISTLQDIFRNLNPKEPMDLIDWEMEIDETLTLPENRLELANKFPQYLWFTDESELRDTKQEAVDELKNYLDYTLGFVDPEIADEIRKLFEDRMGAYRYRIEKNISIAALKRQLSDTKEELEKTKEEARTERQKREAEVKQRQLIPDELAQSIISFLPNYRNLDMAKFVDWVSAVSQWKNMSDENKRTIASIFNGIPLDNLRDLFSAYPYARLLYTLATEKIVKTKEETEAEKDFKLETTVKALRDAMLTDLKRGSTPYFLLFKNVTIMIDRDRPEQIKEIKPLFDQVLQKLVDLDRIKKSGTGEEAMYNLPTPTLLAPLPPIRDLWVEWNPNLSIKEQIRWSIHLALTHVEDGYIWKTTRKISQELGKEEALKFLRNELRNWGFGSKDMPDVQGSNMGVEITLPITNQTFIVKYRDILDYVLNESKDTPYEFVGIKARPVIEKPELPVYDYRGKIIELLSKTAMNHPQLYDYFYTELNATTDEQKSEIMHKVNEVITNLMGANTIEQIGASYRVRSKGVPKPTREEMRATMVKEEPTKPGKPKWNRDLENRLRDVFQATLIDAGLKPSAYMAKLRVEYPILKQMNTQGEMEEYVREIAREVIDRWGKPTKVPTFEPTPPEKSGERPLFRTDEEIERGFRGGVSQMEPQWPPPISDLPFPRRPSGSELDAIRVKFIYDLQMCGIANYWIYNSEFEKNFAGFRYNSMADMRQAYDELVNSICAGKTIPQLAARYRARPYESICEGVQWFVSMKRYNTIEEIIDALYSYGTDATRTDVINCIKQGWLENVPNFAIVTREYLEDLIGEPIE